MNSVDSDLHSSQRPQLDPSDLALIVIFHFDLVVDQVPYCSNASTMRRKLILKPV